MLKVTRLMIILAALGLSAALSGCGLLTQFLPNPPTAVPPTVTRTPIPLPTATATPRPAVQAPPTLAPQNPAPVAPAAPAAPGISNFSARFTGRAIEGSFNVGAEQVIYIYRLQRIDPVGNQLQFTGTIDYTRSSGPRGSVPGLTALLTTQGESCEQVTLATQAVSLPELNTTLPPQNVTVNLADIEGSANAAISAVCQVARTVQDNPNNPIVGFLLGQINRQLAQ